MKKGDCALMDGSLFRKIKEYLMDIMNIGGVIMATITKETIVGDILDIAPETAPAFLNIGMHCLGCPASRNETVEQACMVHGVDTNELLEQLNQVIATNKK
jgi:hybrid cluster-associated redox disulfide protein